MPRQNAKSSGKTVSEEKSDVVRCLTNQNYGSLNTPIDFSRLNKNKENDLERIYNSCLRTISLYEVRNTHKEISLISFKPHHINTDLDDRKTLIFSLEKKKADISNDEKYYVCTGLYAGRITINGVTFNILPDCSDALYKRMLNFANHIYIEKNEEFGKKDKNNDFSLIQYLFLNSLQKVSMMGLPQEYVKHKYHDMRVHGGVDIQNFIKRDIPFKGKISSQKNERNYVQSIVDVLYFALKSCNKEIQAGFNRLAFLKSELGSSFSGKYPTEQTIQNALRHRALNNPMYSDFKDTLKYAEIVIKNSAILPDPKDNSQKASGYLLDVASLWEVYLERLLSKELNGWRVFAQEDLLLYEDSFFERHNYPDLVLRNANDDNQVIILDAKFKKMGFTNNDVDRPDLHQIHSYTGYYSELGKNVVLSGLIYPLSLEISEKDENGNFKDYQNKYKNETMLYGLQKSKTKFVVDGIYKGSSNGANQGYSVLDAEKAFVKRMEKYLEASLLP